MLAWLQGLLWAILWAGHSPWSFALSFTISVAATRPVVDWDWGIEGQMVELHGDNEDKMFDFPGERKQGVKLRKSVDLHWRPGMLYQFSVD